jgi:hypothetical protein
VDKLVGILFFAAFAGCVVFYIIRQYAKMGSGARERWWKLPPGEKLVHEIFGEANIAITTGERVATAAAGVVAGALLGGIGVATVHAPGVNFAITTTNRLHVRLWQDDKQYESRSYHHGQVGVRVIGPGSRKVQGGPSVVVRVEPRDGTRPFEALIHEGYAQLFATLA